MARALYNCSNHHPVIFLVLTVAQLSMSLDKRKKTKYHKPLLPLLITWIAGLTMLVLEWKLFSTIVFQTIRNRLDLDKRFKQQIISSAFFLYTARCFSKFCWSILLWYDGNVSSTTQHCFFSLVREKLNKSLSSLLFQIRQVIYKKNYKLCG